MTDLSARPPFILTFVADTQGCGHHRVLAPLGALVAANLADGRADMAAWSEDQFRACAPDVVVFQRPVEEPQLQALEAARKACPDAFFVYELDDRLDAVPEKSYHAGFIAQSITERVRRGLALCDAASTTTENMATWLRSLGAKDVRVIPNLLPVEKVQPREQQPGRKIRVGWGGGMSHTGDLALLVPAMAAIGDAVEWVFLAAKPEGKLPVRIEFHDGVPPTAYLDKLASLDLDLILAPLEDNVFNCAKSNLRLVEAGAVGAAVIASPVGPYTEGQPPVFGYAADEAAWVAEIRRFINTPASERTKAARALQAWVGRHYTFEARIKDRLAAWLPEGVATFRPRAAKEMLEQVVVCAPGGRASVTLPDSLRHARIEQSLPVAAQKARDLGADLLYVRPSASMTEDGWHRLRTALIQSPDIAAVVPLAPDGPNAYPRLDAFVPTSDTAARAVQDIVGHRLVRRHLAVPVLGGPVMLLGRNALAMLGAPDPAEGDEAGILEWGLRGIPRGWRFVQAADAYAGAVVPPPAATPTLGQRMAQRGYVQFVARAQSEALPSAEREAVELALLRDHWNGVRPGVMGFANDYATWAQLRPKPDADACTTLTASVRSIPFGGAMPDDAPEWLIFYDDRVTFKPLGLGALVEACAKAGSEVTVIYADHEVRDGLSLSPDFKPDFDFDLLLARDYVTPVCAVRASYLDEVPSDRTSLYRHVLMCGLTDPGGRIQHVPQVLATVEARTPEEAALDAVRRQQVLEDLFAEGAVTIEPSKAVIGALNVRRVARGQPLASIIVPTKGDGWMLQPCIGTLLRLTTYPNFEVVVMHNGDSAEPDLGEWKGDPRVRVVRWQHPYNWSTLNNDAVREHAFGDMLLFMNDDVRIVEPAWLDRMVGQAQRPDVGAVGARLLYPTGHVQHVGVLCHKGICGHVHKGAQPGAVGNWGLAVLTHQSTAVTGAVMLCRREVFETVGGFDESYAHNYNDVLFCLAARKRGLVNVVECGAELIHYEGATRITPMSPEGLKILQADNARLAPHVAEADPYWNPNFAIALSGDQLMLHGLDGNMLVWDEVKPPETATRVLLVNDRPGFDGRVFLEHESGRVPMLADLSGFVLRLVAPAPANAPGWDIRQPTRIAEALRLLGIDRVVLRSLVGQYGAAPPVESLRGFAKLGVPVDIDPLDPALVCPWLDDSGRDGAAEQFGDVDQVSWRAAYDALAGAPTEVAA